MRCRLMLKNFKTHWIINYNTNFLASRSHSAPQKTCRMRTAKENLWFFQKKYWKRRKKDGKFEKTVLPSRFHVGTFGEAKNKYKREKIYLQVSFYFVLTRQKCKWVSTRKLHDKLVIHKRRTNKSSQQQRDTNKNKTISNSLSLSLDISSYLHELF